MPTLTQTKPCILNTLVTGPDNEVLYEVSTDSKVFSGSVTTISRGGAVLATVEWHKFGTTYLTFEGRTAALKDIFPKSSTLSKSRIYTTQTGVSFKWKHGGELYCVSTETGLNIATYYRIRFAVLRSKLSTLDISGGSEELMDSLVVTWVIMEKIDKDRRD
ncbi:hypothetical protein FS749_007329 [Ceratobasidium sp. UAMH 11750]|nr:hypothetical protein FS749_007329 [Ceratobasidium sp. UAMH 11750]